MNKIHVLYLLLINTHVGGEIDLQFGIIQDMTIDGSNSGQGIHTIFMVNVLQLNSIVRHDLFNYCIRTLFKMGFNDTIVEVGHSVIIDKYTAKQFPIVAYNMLQFEKV